MSDLSAPSPLWAAPQLHEEDLDRFCGDIIMMQYVTSLQVEDSRKPAADYVQGEWKPNDKPGTTMNATGNETTQAAALVPQNKSGNSPNRQKLLALHGGETDPGGEVPVETSDKRAQMERSSHSQPPLRVTLPPLTARPDLSLPQLLPRGFAQSLQEASQLPGLFPGAKKEKQAEEENKTSGAPRKAIWVILFERLERYPSSSPRKMPPLKAQGHGCHFGGGRRDPCDRSEEGGVSAGRAGPVKSHAGRVRTLRAPLRATGRPRRGAASPQPLLSNGGLMKSVDKDESWGGLKERWTRVGAQLPTGCIPGQDVWKTKFALEQLVTLSTRQSRPGRVATWSYLSLHL
ncbi:hypothetical protein D4764_15G0012960 [Takifugu flavidus]|uniref:Uncharacterized protein n=1 Tax=Takifugu flavidus TaxID=433684 RepID=A0A5C6P6U2_9TELE|nr:hypothetical protein D4764_15G0012960 [Takifugu flavidus]